MHKNVPGVFVSATLLFAAAPYASADGVLHAFHGSPDGATPIAPLVADAAGNLYGTTFTGGSVNNIGTVFELSPNGTGGYTYRQIYAFQYAAGDAENPNGALLIDSHGNLFGTSMLGGAGGVGAIFELSPIAGGGWSEKVVYSFTSGTGDGFYPSGGVISDSAGNLYGVAQNGGTSGTGVVFELSPNGSGGWNESVLYSFTGSRNSGPDGAAPLGGLTMDAAGNLFGTTYLGGVHRDGAVFELSPVAGGGWTEKIIHSFNGNDGCNPQSSLVWDAAGNLYGTTSNLGSDISPNCNNYGAVFKLTPPTTTVGWPETMVHRFLANDGNYPNGIVFDSAGNIYGTTYLGGKLGYGGVFKLTPTGTGTWTETAVHTFTGQTDGGYPRAGVIIGPDGELYGTASSFGAHNAGVVFQNHP